MKQILVVGDGPCGKTSLILSFLKLEQSMNDNMLKFPFESEVVVNGKKEKLSLVDTLGCSVTHSITVEQSRYVNAIVILFSVDNRDSFEYVRYFWVPEILKRSTTVPYVIVGNKTDLRPDAEAEGDLKNMNQSFVTKEEGKAMAKEMKSKEYVECSALKKEDATNVFNTVFRILEVEPLVERNMSSEKSINTREKNCTVL